GWRACERAETPADRSPPGPPAQGAPDFTRAEGPKGPAAPRGAPPFHRDTSPGYLAVNANKRSISVDLKDAAAVERLLPLIGEADVLVQNLKPGSLEALGLGAEALTARFPRLIYCCVWAFGPTGPMKLKPRYEPLVH